MDHPIPATIDHITVLTASQEGLGIGTKLSGKTKLRNNRVEYSYLQLVVYPRRVLVGHRPNQYPTNSVYC